MNDFSATGSGLRVSPIGRLRRRCGDSLEDISEYKEERLTEKQFPSVESVSSALSFYIPENHLNFQYMS